MMRRNAPGLLLCSIGLLSACGCAGERVRPLSSALFVPATPDGPPVDSMPDLGAKVASDRQSAVNPGDFPKKASILPSPNSDAAVSDIKPIEPLPAGPTTNPAGDLQSSEAAPVEPAPASVVNSTDPVPPSPPPADPQPAAHGPMVDAGQRGSQGQGVYMTLGGVVAVVNDTPIFANQVLEPLNRELSIKAKEMEESEFRDFAMKEIVREAYGLIQDEVYFAEAYHALSDDDRKLAQEIAISSRFQRVTAAGGSVELARQKSVEQGEDFDESLKKEYRIIVVELRERHIDPLIQITADDMRAFYRRNVDKRYSDKDKIQFRLIEIDPHFCGGMQPAIDKIGGIREKAIHGADFAALAAADNDDTFCKAHGGNPMDAGEWVERNSYPNEALEKALWQLQPGQITPVVKTDNLLYIAKLEARHNGVIRPFEDPAVQADIYKNLRESQRQARKLAAHEEAFDPSMIDFSEERLQVALDMAMQKYAQIARQ